MDDQSHNRRSSLSPSVRRGDRLPLRSSPLAGHSYSADKGGNLIEHSSALEQEIERRRIDGGLPTPPASRKVSVDEGESPRRARPSFISLAPRPGSRDSLVPPSPVSPPLRSRHSSPHIVANPRFSQSTSSLPHTESNAKPRASADWMTAAPAPSFSRLAARSSGVVLPVKASSREGERLRHKSLPPKSAAPKPVPKGDSNHGEHVKTLKSFRSMGKLFKHDHDHDHEVENVSPVPPTPLGPESHTGSAASSAHSPRDVPTSKGAYLEPLVVTREHERGRVRKLWSKVMGGVKRSKA